MRIAFIAAGAGGMYCGSCLRDAALARDVNALGHEMTLVPLYTPLRLEDDAGERSRVFLGAVDVYLEERFSSFRRRRGALGRLLGSQTLLRWLSRFSLEGSPERMGRMAVSLLRGSEGHQRRSIDELVGYLGSGPRPEVVHLTNALLCGLARPVREALGVPIVCGLQGEDIFLDGLPEAHRAEARRLIGERSRDVDRFIAVSRYYASRASEVLGIVPSRIDVVLSGVRAEEFLPARPDDRRHPTIGYLARIAPEKGLHVLAEAFERLCRSGKIAGVRLRVAGYLGGRHIRYAAAVRRRISASGLGDRMEILGTLQRAQKLEFLRSVDVLAVPSVYPDAKGLFALEALAAGLPVVQPRLGALPEIIDASGGGLVHEPGDAEDLAAKLELVLGDSALRLELGAKGRAAALHRFHTRRVASETLEVYRKALATRGAEEGAA